MTWARTTYPISNVDNGIERIQDVRGLSNGTFGIRYTDGVGFRVTHLNTGWLISKHFFTRLRDAVAFCEQIEPVADWKTMTVESGMADKDRITPLLTAIAKQYERRRVRVHGDEAWVETVEAA